MENFGDYFDYTIQSPKKAAVVVTPVSVSERMREAQSRIVWPEEFPATNHKMKLRNDIIKFLQTQKMGWNPHNVDSHVVPFVITLADVLWYLDGHYKKFSDRSKAIPAPFCSFTGYFDAVARKRTKPENAVLDPVVLKMHSQALNQCIEQPWLQKKEWHAFREALTALADNLHGYSVYLLEHQQRTRENQQQLQPVRGVCARLTFLSGHQSISTTLAERYNSLCAKLQVPQCFEPLPLVDLLPDCARQHRHFIDDIDKGLPVFPGHKVVRYTYSTGNALGNTHFLWKVPVDLLEETLIQENAKVCIHVYTEVCKLVVHAL